MRQLLKDFNCNTYNELNELPAFKIMLLNICKHRKESYRYWRPIKNGFILITKESYLEFLWVKKDYLCNVESNIYS